MRSRTVTVHYCDHCGAKKFTRPAMERHEAGCTANINRHCGHCEQGALDQAEFHDLIAALGGGSDAEFDALVDVADGCPACIQAAVRWWREMMNEDWQNDVFREAPQLSWPGPQAELKVDRWSYIEAAREFWSDVNRNRAEEFRRIVGFPG